MAHLHLPPDHDAAEREIALAVARVLNSSDLYVTWTGGAGSTPPAASPAPARAPRRRGVRGLLGVLARRRGV
jgi:hypothetical protein